jgi:hypothetical protein
MEVRKQETVGRIQDITTMNGILFMLTTACDHSTDNYHMNSLAPLPAPLHSHLPFQSSVLLYCSTCLKYPYCYALSCHPLPVLCCAEQLSSRYPLPGIKKVTSYFSGTSKCRTLKRKKNVYNNTVFPIKSQ